MVLLFAALTVASRGAAATDSPEPPQIEPTRGFHEHALRVHLASTTPDVGIWYTLDGTEPEPARGRRYVEPFEIQSTTVVRAAAFLGGSTRSATVTHTYLFPSQTVNQTGAGFPAAWGTNQGGLVPADYEMDPEITNRPEYRGVLGPALRALPTVSLVLEPAALFDPAHGIYSNPRQTGADWERPASLEWIPAPAANALATNTRSQINCGVRIQGGWNRRPEESPKHSFRIVFRKKYGPGKWRHPLFGDEGSEEFDEFILRAGCNNTWLHWSSPERRRGDYLRDQWMRDSYAAMGHPSARGRFVHLYLNGLYWGLYNLVERPSAPFVAAHFGGKPDRYDVRNADNILSGDDTAWRRLFDRINAGVPQAEEYREVQSWIDLPALIDFLILNFYGANADWDRGSNWYAARRRQPAGPFHFFVWDGERTLENATDNTLEANDDQSPTRLFQRLRQNARFRSEFATRARRHLTGEGALSPLACAARYRRLADQIELAIVAESARWGDYRRDVHRYKEGPYELYTRDDHWRPEVTRLLNDYFPRRSAIVMEQFQAAGLRTSP